MVLTERILAWTFVHMIYGTLHPAESMQKKWNLITACRQSLLKRAKSLWGFFFFFMRQETHLKRKKLYTTFATHQVWVWPLCGGIGGCWLWLHLASKQIIPNRRSLLNSYLLQCLCLQDSLLFQPSLSLEGKEYYCPFSLANQKSGSLNLQSKNCSSVYMAQRVLLTNTIKNIPSANKKVSTFLLN